MEQSVVKNLILIVFSIACLACVVGICFVLFESVSRASDSPLQAFGVVCLFVMVLGFVGRYLWQNKRNA